jgi:hypothetical protein
MSELVILLVISVPVLAVLAVHIFRDVRGGARNRSGLCYACGKEEADQWVAHHKGGRYRYCHRCASWHERAKALFIGVTISAFALVLGAGILRSGPINTWSGLAILCICAIVLLAALYAIVRYLVSRIRS